MASIITATTANGLVSSADNSGVLQLASGTGNLVTVPSVTGTAMVSANMPAFSAYQNAAQTLTANTWTKLIIETEEFDTASCFDSTTNYRFTPNVAGYYQISGGFGMASSIRIIVCAIYKNNSRYKRGSQSGSAAASGWNSQVSALVYLNGSTDYVEIYGYQGDSVSQNTLGSGNVDVTYFQGVLVRAA